MLRLLLIDDNPIFLKALDRALKHFPNVRVVGRAAYAPEGLRLAIDLAPDLVLSDLTMPDLNGIALTRQVRDRHPATQVVIISMHDGEDYRAAARTAGALAFINKFHLLDALPALLAEVRTAVRPAAGLEDAR
jgi:two-component system, NarL family, nitrate/nitrite response regulator NarL